jgi:hypothetical protein
MLPTLYAMRILLDELITEAERGAAPPALRADDDGTGCPHPPARQLDASTLGGPPTILCLECGAQRLGVAP